MTRRHKPYDWQADPEDSWGPFAEALRRIRNFLGALKDQGIHVGIGSPPSCATCGQVWPCQHSRQMP